MSSQTIGFFEACIYLYGGENKFNGYSRSVKQVFEFRVLCFFKSVAAMRTSTGNLSPESFLLVIKERS